jgi:hypothetical protein
LSSSFKPFMGQSWADFVSTNAKLASFIYLQSRYFGIVAIIPNCLQKRGEVGMVFSTCG